MTRLALVAAFGSMLLLPFGGVARATQGTDQPAPGCTTRSQTWTGGEICPPKIKTKVSKSSILVGESVTDLATLNGENNGDDTPGGWVAFYLCGPGQTAAECASGGAQVGSPVATVDGVSNSTATSAPVSPTGPGVYCFRAEFQPGPNEPFAPGSETNNTTECFSVSARADIGIHIVKGGPKLAHVGDTITYTFTVSLTTPEPLGSITLTDPVCNTAPAYVSGDDGDAILEPGETWTYTCDHVATAKDPDPLPNTATVTGTSQDGRTATDSDDHVVDLIHPAIKIVKTVAPTSGSAGETVTYRYVVTNTGDTTLYKVRVTDDVLGTIGTVAKLEPGHSVTFTKDSVLPKGAASLKNVGTATGSDALGLSVSAKDDAVVTIVAAASASASPSAAPGTAFTGSDSASLGALAGGLTLLGLLGLAVGRKRTGEV